MEQELVVVRINETVRRDTLYRKYETQRIPISKLRMGAEIKLSDQRNMNVVQFTDEELTFIIDNQRCYTLNRYWQVLGTVKMDVCPTLSEKETERFALYFETLVDKPETGVYERIVEIYNTMKENSEDMEIWKNIPLGRELVHLFKTARLRAICSIPIICLKRGISAAGAHHIRIVGVVGSNPICSSTLL